MKYSITKKNATVLFLTDLETVNLPTGNAITNRLEGLATMEGNICMVFNNSKSDAGIYAHEIGHTLHCRHTFLDNDSLALSEEIANLNRKLKIEENDFKEDNKNTTTIDNIAFYKKKISDKSREIILFESKSTANIMDYSTSKDSWFSWQWMILRDGLRKKIKKEE
ncbi:MAG: hypothetical protein ACK5IQ_07615 [Bacteroidales bacterium]